MKKTACDRCGKDVTEGSWEDGFGKLKITFNKSSCNELLRLKHASGTWQKVTYKMLDICYDCQQKIQKVLLAALKEIEQ